ncbi:coiled-coil domain-containing protein 63 [Porphyrio hochstetteri]
MGSSKGATSLKQKLAEFPVQDKEKLAEAEIRRMRKQFYIAAEKRKSYSANVRQQMQAQEKEIESLTQEHNEVTLELKNIMSLRNMRLHDKNYAELQGLLETKSQYDSLIRERKAMLADLEKQILKLEKKVVVQNQILTKAKQAKCIKQTQKQIETLEMRLNNVTVHFDTILTRNYELREEIKSLRIQKDTLDNFFLKLQMKLDEQRRRMNTAVEQSTQAYEQRMDALARISAMKERHTEDTIQYNIKLQEYERALQESKVKTFMLAKYKDRSDLEEQAKKKRVLKAAQREKQNQWESPERRTVAYKRLMELAKDGDVDQLVNDFIQKEGKNFACFSYINELNNKMEKMQQRIKDLQNEITAFEVDKKHVESSNLHVLRELEERLTDVTKEAKKYEDRCKLSNKVLGQLIANMETLFKGIGCDATEIMNQLGESEHITDTNLMQFFGILEKKTMELLLMESVLQYTLSEAAQLDQSFTNPVLPSTGLHRTMDRAQLSPPTPSLDSAIDSIDTLEVPMDHKELRQLILRREKEQSTATSRSKKKRNGMKVWESVRRNSPPLWKEPNAFCSLQVIFWHSFAHC